MEVIELDSSMSQKVLEAKQAMDKHDLTNSAVLWGLGTLEAHAKNRSLEEWVEAWGRGRAV